MRFLKKTTITLLAASGFFTAAYSQDTTNTIGKVSIASPTAASLGKYGDIPVSYHTGLPNISIPIYTVESGSLKLPVDLSYHASGLKVQEQASWVGAGWSLNAGGMITRTVVGGPDDRGYMTSLCDYGYYSDTGYCNYYANESDDQFFAKGYRDGEPDLYFFNFGGYSGKFYFNDDRTPMLVPEQDFKILPFLQTGGRGFAGFIVTTPDGTKYYFGSVGNYSSSIDPIEATNPITTQNGPSNTTAAASSWFLNKIMSSDGTDSITFTYVQESYSYYSQIWSPVLGSKFNYPAADGTLNGFNVAKDIVQGVRLTQINFKNGSIVFTPSASPRQDLSNSAGLLTGTTMVDRANTNSYSLGSISIKNASGFCKKDSLYYGYFYDNSTLNSTYYNTAFVQDSLHTDEYRLRLDSIQETSCDNSLKVPPYKFTYFSEMVPRKLSFAIDHWGYPNGQSANPSMIPTFVVITNGTPQSFTGANRDASWPAMRGGSLQKITYPTGGYTTLDFEPKCIYTYNTSTLQQVNLTGYTLNMYGQSQITQTNSFTLNSDGACTLFVNNNCTNWQPTLTIYNSSSQLVYNSGYITTTLNINLSLPAGNYTGTLAYPSNATGLNGGATGQIGQYQYVSHSTSQTVGGLRIKTITNNDGLSPNNIVTSFSYAGNLTSTGGVLYSIPTYVQIIRNDVKKNIQPFCSLNGCFSCDLSPTKEYYITAGSVRPMQTLQGENVGYNEVDVSQTGNGTTKYYYYNSNMWSTYPADVCVRTLIQSGGCDANIPNYPNVPLPFEFMRDELQTEMQFNQAGKLLKEVDHYPVYVNDPLSTPGLVEINIPGLWSNSQYELHTAYKSQDKTVTTTYDPTSNNSLVTTSITYYGSPYHHQPTRTVITTSTGDSLITTAKYAMDFRIPGCDAIPDSMGYYYAKFRADSVNMGYQLQNCTPQDGSINDCRAIYYQFFRDTMAMDRSKFVTYRRRSYANDVSNLQSACYLSAQSTADTLLKPVLRLQTMYDNAQIETSEWKNTNLLHASFIRYDTSTSPIGYAYPERTKLLSLQAPSSTFTNAAVSGTTISKDSRYMDEDYYTFSSGNPQEVTGRDGVTNTYIWDYLNTEPIAKITNAAQSQVAYTSFEADGKGGWTFSGTPVTDATSPTGGKCYNLSNGSITKSGLTSAATIVSFWQKAGGTVTLNHTGGSGTMVAGKVINNWYYYEFTITGTTAVTISGTGTLDELRLYPADAQMATYTYTPLLGMTSACDADNRITYYFYDNLGRLKWIKDQDLNIIKTIQYHYQTITGLQY